MEAADVKYGRHLLCEDINNILTNFKRFVRGLNISHCIISDWKAGLTCYATSPVGAS